MPDISYLSEQYILMIEFSDDLIFAEGARRYCYVHPDDPGKCIKILSSNGSPAKRRSEVRGYKI